MVGLGMMLVDGIVCTPTNAPGLFVMAIVQVTAPPVTAPPVPLLFTIVKLLHNEKRVVELLMKLFIVVPPGVVVVFALV